MQPMGAAHLIQHPLCNLFGRHFSFAKKMLFRDNTGPALVRIAIARLTWQAIALGSALLTTKGGQALIATAISCCRSINGGGRLPAACVD